MSSATALTFLILLMLGISIEAALEPNRTHLRVKTAQLNGNLDVTVAEFGLEFPEPIYFQFPAPCPAGRCPVERQLAALEANPCLMMPCDFTLKGPDCGKARLPECEPICAAQRAAFCPPIQDWIVLTLGVESDPIPLSFRDPDVYLRVNFDQPCAALVVQVISIYGGTVALPFDLDQINPTTSDCCQFASPPEGVTTVCPSFLQCYHYGTYFLRLKCYEADALATVRVFALEIEPGPQRTASLPEAPMVVYPDPVYPYHVPLFWSVPFTYVYPPTGAYVPFLLSTYHCGFVTIQANLDAYDLALSPESLSIFVSLDPANPFPSSITSDMIFFSHPFSKIFLCQDDPSQPPARLFLLVARAKGAALGTPATLTITVEYDRPGLIPMLPPQKAGDRGTWSNHTAWPAGNLYGFALGTLQIKCPDLPALKCAFGCEIFGCCQNTWPAYPTGPSLQPLFPVPYPLRFLNEGIIGNDFSYFPKYLNPRMMGVVLLLEENFGGSLQYGPLGPNWRQILPTCTVSTGESGMGTLDGRWIEGSYQPELLLTESCDPDQFNQISDDIDTLFGFLIQNSPDNVGNTRPLSLRYRTDIMTVLDDWIDCQNLVQAELLVETIIDLHADQTKTCPIYDPEDPCCNPQLAWNQCCAPRSLEFSLRFGSNVTADLDSRCPLPTCSEPILEAYIQGTRTQITGECEPAILESPTQIVTQTTVIFAECLQRYLGDDFKGQACFSDADCPSVVGSRCDLLAHRCLGNFSALTRAMIDCVVATLPAPVTLTLIAEAGWTEALEAQALTDLILAQYTNSFCIDAYYPIGGTLYRPYFHIFSPFPGCPPSDYYALTRMTQPPVWAAGRQVIGGNCAYDLSMVSPKMDAGACEAAEVFCPGGVCDTGFCGWCETPASCRSLPQISSEAECANLGPLCLLADGQIVTGLTSTECENQYRCTGSCPSGPCGSGDACEASGRCLDTEEVYFLLEQTYWAGNHSRTGVCAFPMAPYDDPDCYLLYPGSYPTSYGCLSFGHCEPLGFALNCVVTYDDQNLCEGAGGQWYPRPLTQAQCQNPVLCNVPRYTGTRSAIWESNFHYESVFPSASDCENCGGSLGPVNTWIRNQWVGGASRPATWLESTPTPRYHFEPSLDFAELAQDIIRAAEDSTNFQTLNALQCTYGNQKAQIKRLACNCVAELDRNSCFAADTVAPIGQGRFCPATENRIVSPPFTLQSTFNSLASSVRYECIPFEISKIAAQVFDPPPLLSVTIGFKRRDNRAWTSGSYTVVSNSREAIVGAVIGDGIGLTFANLAAAEAVSEVYFCEVLPNYIVPDLGTYPSYDLGFIETLTGGVVVRPLHLNVSYYPGANQLCGIIPLSGELNSAYVPIVRVADDAAVEGVTLTASEEACLYAIASLFALALGYGLILVIKMILAGVFEVRRPATVVWICALWIFLQRTIYLYLVASDVLNQPNAHQLADYFMIDFPMCLYLIANFQIGVSFLLLHFKPEAGPRLFWMIFAGGAFLIVMLFVGVLLAYRYEVLNQDAISGPLLCPIYYDATGTARTIRLIYQSIILFVSLVIGLTEMILGGSLYSRIAEMSRSSRVLVLGVTASLGIITNSIAFLIYYIIDDPTPYFAIVLIFTEIIPIGVLLFLLTLFAYNNADTLSSYSPSPHSPTSKPRSA